MDETKIQSTKGLILAYYELGNIYSKTKNIEKKKNRYIYTNIYKPKLKVSYPFHYITLTKIVAI